MRKIIFVILIFGILFTVGCSNKSYFENNQDVKQDILDMINNNENTDSYIAIKTKHMEEILRAGEKPKELKDLSLSDDDMFREGEISVAMQYKKMYIAAEDYLKLDKEGRTKDYYKAIVARAVVSNELSGWIESTEESVGYIIDELGSEEVELGLTDDVFINLNLIIENAASELGLTYEECLEDVYRQYIISESIVEYHRMYYLKNNYPGEKVEYSSDNEEEYEKCFFDVYHGYNEYMENLVNELLNAH